MGRRPRRAGGVDVFSTNEADRGIEPIQEILRIAREYLDMEAAFVAEFRHDQEILRWVEGDIDELPLSPGDSASLEQTYCQLVAATEETCVIADTATDPRAADLLLVDEVGIGSYVGIPILFSDGRLYGTLCCLSQEARPSIARKDVDVVTALARMVAGELERRQLLEKQWHVQLQAAGIDALLAALAARDGYTGEHSDAVVDLAESVARHLKLSDDELGATSQVALLHDIGKIGIPDSVLRKPGPLDAQEWRIMREHPIIGARIVDEIPELRHLTYMIRAEHERWDGNGYPDGLYGVDIPLASRIALVCDAYHAMVSNRPYRKAMPDAVARRELAVKSGTQFDPDIAAALLAVLDEAGPLEVVIDLDKPPIRVLLVDDDFGTRMLLRFTLESEGCFEVVGEAGDGAEAIAMVRAEQPDAVVVDLAMPVMSGLQAIPAMRRESPGSKIVVFTASDSPEIFREAFDAGADHCQGKGVSLTEVGRSIRALVAAKQDARPSSDAFVSSAIRRHAGS
jgi:response regulator RpfG family c-di-GMP phosphodiesterase